LSFGDIFRFIDGLESSGGEVGVEFDKGFSGDISCEFIFIDGSFFSGVHDSDTGGLGVGDSDVVSESFSESISDLGGGHEDLSL